MSPYCFAFLCCGITVPGIHALDLAASETHTEQRGSTHGKRAHGHGRAVVRADAARIESDGHVVMLRANGEDDQMSISEQGSTSGSNANYAGDTVNEQPTLPAVTQSQFDRVPQYDAATQATCQDTHDGAKDSWGDDCAYYASASSTKCSQYDDDDFTANEMCCYCAEKVCTTLTVAGQVSCEAGKDNAKCQWDASGTPPQCKAAVSGPPAGATTPANACDMINCVGAKPSKKEGATCSGDVTSVCEDTCCEADDTTTTQATCADMTEICPASFTKIDIATTECPGDVHSCLNSCCEADGDKASPKTRTQCSDVTCSTVSMQQKDDSATCTGTLGDCISTCCKVHESDVVDGPSPATTKKDSTVAGTKGGAADKAETHSEKANKAAKKAEKMAKRAEDAATEAEKAAATAVAANPGATPAAAIPAVVPAPVMPIAAGQQPPANGAGWTVSGSVKAQITPIQVGAPPMGR